MGWEENHQKIKGQMPNWKEKEQRGKTSYKSIRKR